MKATRWISVFAILVISVFTALMPLAHAEDVMYVGVSPDTYLRSNPSAEKPYLARMPYGSTVTFFDSEISDVDGDDWSYINYNGQLGYCRSKYLQYDDPYAGEEPHPVSQEDAFGNNLLQKGNNTPDFRVRNLQLCLVEAGFLDNASEVDGFFGSTTKRALIAFQEENELEGAGKAGKTTKKILWKQFEVFLRENGVMQ